MKTQRKVQVIVVGDSFNNTLGLIRSLGEAGVKPVLILVGKDRLFISKSRYVGRTIMGETLEDAMKELRELSAQYEGAYVICSNDKAAEMLDRHESEFSTAVSKTHLRAHETKANIVCSLVL